MNPETSKPGSEKIRVRWYNPISWAARGAEMFYETGSREIVSAVDGVTSYPRAVIRGVKEAKARNAVASEYEKMVTRWTLLGWAAAIVLGVGLFRILPNGFTGLVVIILGAGFFFRGKRDLVREQVVALLRSPEECQVNPLTLELAAVRLEETETIIRAWKGLPRTERLGLAASVLLRCLETLSRELPDEISVANTGGAGDMAVDAADATPGVAAADGITPGEPQEHEGTEAGQESASATVRAEGVASPKESSQGAKP